MSDPNFLSRRALWMQKLADEVAKGIVDKIRRGELAPGDALPDRSALGAEFVTSDSVVERALEHLVQEGIAERDAGGTLRVAPGAAQGGRFELPRASEATIEDVLAVMELRIGVESQAAALAARRAGDADIARLKEAAAAYDRATETGNAPGRADFAFHAAIGAASGNPYIADLIQYLGPLLIPRMRLHLLKERARAKSKGQSARDHAAIVAAIEARDAELAERLMRTHLTKTRAAIEDAARASGE